ncbi:MAG: thiamine-phosphate kinase, partial [Candidatus Omnitrophica bacterium]|nr:thiamine-phosphate kinase [Candidatus Omnitrophota bacterium]
MNISRLGEFGLIQRIRRQIKTGPSVVQGIGDDCAVIRYSRDEYLLYTCDMIVEGIDFTRGTDPVLVGRKAIAVSISDIAACGGIPSHCLVSLGLPKQTPVGVVDRLYKGITGIAREFNVDVVGGDISKADRLVLDVSMAGLVKHRHLALRSAARPGDILFATGSFGGSIRGKHLTFVPRLAESQYLVRNFGVHAMIDVSDGLLQDLSHILAESRVGVI